MTKLKILVYLVFFPLFLESCGDGRGFPEALSAGRSLYYKRDFANAEFSLSKALAIQKKHPEALFLRGKCFFFKKRFAEALADFKLVRSVSPRHTGALLWAVRSELAMGRPQARHEAELRELIAFDEENVGAQQVLGALLEQRGDLAGALEAYQRSLIYEDELRLSHGRVSNIEKALGGPWARNRPTTNRGGRS